jgi:Ca-activated chloride channel family protein
MGFEWPLALLSLLAVPLLFGAYLWQIRRRRRRAVTYSSVALIRAAAPARSAWRRHVPIALVLCVLACLGLAAARPQLKTDVPVSGSSVILALDVSGSMCSTDVDPNRLSAAQAAVHDFVKQQNSSTRIGLVVFSGFAQVAVAPTTERDELFRAIDSLTTGRGTTIGAAILKSVDAIAAINPDVAPADGDQPASPTPAPSSGTGSPSAAPRSFAPEIVVLLTDGANTAGIEPVDAAEIAASRGVRVYPIGFGTANPTSLVCTAKQLGGREFGGFGGGPGGGFGGFGGGRGGGGNFLVADDATLQKVASVTGGTFFSAKNADQLQKVLKDLPHRVKIQQRDVELSVVFVGLATLLVLLTLWAAARWTAFPT